MNESNIELDRLVITPYFSFFLKDLLYIDRIDKKTIKIFFRDDKIPTKTIIIDEKIDDKSYTIDDFLNASLYEASKYRGSLK